MRHPGQKFTIGSIVQIVDRQALSNFLQSQPKKPPHPLLPEQLEHAGTSGRITQALMYQGGAIAYVLEGLPGAWYQTLVHAPLDSN
jgi:hypothetical protein